MNSAIVREIGVRLRESRLAAHLTQEEVARDFQITRQAVSAWERGRNLPSVAELWELCQLYGSSSDLILYGMKTVPASAHAVVQHLFRLREPVEKG